MTRLGRSFLALALLLASGWVPAQAQGKHNGTPGPSARPPGWDRGRKVGWGDCDLPPGLAMKSGCHKDVTVAHPGHDQANIVRPPGTHGGPPVRGEAGVRRERQRPGPEARSH